MPALSEVEVCASVVREVDILVPEEHVCSQNVIVYICTIPLDSGVMCSFYRMHLAIRAHAGSLGLQNAGLDPLTQPPSHGRVYDR